MPTISMFREIKICLYWNDHMPPQFHAFYGSSEVLVSIDDLEVMDGIMPSKQLKMLLGRAAFHQEELCENRELAKGFDRKTASYFANGRKQITDVCPNDDFTLTIGFGNGEKRLYDVRPLLNKGTAFEPLAKIENFKRVYIDERHCIAWDIDPTLDSTKIRSNKIDLCPDSCYLDSTPI